MSQFGKSANRRTFLAAIAGCGTWGLVADAQQPKRVGVVLQGGAHLAGLAGVRDASVAARLLDVSLLVHEGKGDLRGKHSSPVRHSRAKCGRQRSNWKHGYYSANAKQVRREARRQFRLLRQLMAAGNEDDVLDLISSM